MKVLKMFLILSLLVLVKQGVAQEELEVGEKKIIPFYERAYVAPSGAIDAKETEDKKAVIVTGMREGIGTLFIRYEATGRTETRDFRVYARKPERVIEELKGLLKGIEGIRYRRAGGKVIIEGKIRTEIDKVIFNKIIPLYPEVIDLTEKEDLLIEISATVIEVSVQDAFKFDLNPVSIDTLGLTSVWWKKSGGDIDKGFAWSLSVDILQSIKTLIEAGRAKVISNPRIVTNDGKKAKILAGGEVPYTIIGPQGVPSIEWKTWGIKLEVTPHRKITDEIFMELYIEASEPGPGVPPPITSRNAEIQVSVPSGKTLIIGGLFNTRVNRATRAGCLWPIFRYGWEKENREILVLVTPKAPSGGIPIGDFKRIKEEDIKR